MTLSFAIYRQGLQITRELISLANLGAPPFPPAPLNPFPPRNRAGGELPDGVATVSLIEQRGAISSVDMLEKGPCETPRSQPPAGGTSAESVVPHRSSHLLTADSAF